MSVNLHDLDQYNVKSHRGLGPTVGGRPIHYEGPTVGLYITRQIRLEAILTIGIMAGERRLDRRDKYLRKKEITPKVVKITGASRLSENNTRIRIIFGATKSGTGYTYWSRHDCTSIIFYHAD